MYKLKTSFMNLQPTLLAWKRKSDIK